MRGWVSVGVVVGVVVFVGVASFGGCRECLVLVGVAAFVVKLGTLSPPTPDAQVNKTTKVK